MPAQNLPDGAVEARRSGVSWGAIFAGAVAAAALSLVLYLLGSGLGFAAVSPWSDNSGVALGISAILWLTFTQLAASAVGGYLAGRLRVKWASVRTDEVYFRDTAHGMLSWAVATLVTAAFFGGLMSKMAGTAVDAGAGVAKTAVASGAAATAAVANNDGGNENSAGTNPLDYFSDMLLRSEKPGTVDDANLRRETVRILANSVPNGSLATEDRAYLATRIAERTGLDRVTAERRVDDVYARSAAAAAKAKATAKEAADKARKAAAGTALWLTVSLFIGAFIASWCATIGGRLRDN
ncbi:MAG TPA: hypothetical protein DDX04_05070 [Massilia sp.]|nr:hypothetical protein [Massilia sp.]